MCEMLQTDRAEAEKVQQLLAYEERRRCDLEGILDQSQKEARDQKHHMQAQVLCIPAKTCSRASSGLDMLFAGHMQLSGLLLTFAMKAVISSVFAVYCMNSTGLVQDVSDTYLLAMIKA